MSTPPTTAVVTTEPESPLAPMAPPALELMQRTEIDIQVSTAKKYPRPEMRQIRQRILSVATLDEETAQGCFYTLKRFDTRTQETKLIQGPSVRLAEIAVASYGNLRAGARVIDNDGRKITSQGVCFDLENDVMFSSEVQRRITGRDGRTFSEDMQIVTANAANAIAFRNAVFKVIPLALIGPVFEQCKLVATGGAATLVAKRDKVFKRFYSMGVDQDQILRVLGKESIDSVDLEDLASLIGLGTSIRDHEITVEEAFRPPGAEEEAPVGATGRVKLRDRLAARRAERKAAEAPAAEKAPEAEKQP
jgi:hypothetical protein